MQLSLEKLKQHAANGRLHIVVQGINLLLVPVFQLSTVLHA
jgi:solute carrier family 10 (sodium/bile acid cotransporter), member 7